MLFRSGTRVSTPEISYDGKYSIINYTTVLKDGKRAYSKYIIETSTGNILSEVSNYDDLMWMPKSNKLSFTKIGMNGRELRSLDPQNSREVLIADMLPKGYVSWSPEEDYLLFSVRDEFPADKKDLQIILTPDDRIIKAFSLIL